MKFTTKIAVFFVTMAISLSAMGGQTVGGGVFGKTRLELTMSLLQQTELQHLTLLPLSEKDIEKETDIPEDLKFIPDEEFADLLDVTTVLVTDDSGKVVKTFSVRRIDETPQALVFVEVTEPCE